MNRHQMHFRKQAGLGIGYLLLLIVLVVLVGAATMKFNSDSTPSTTGQQAQLDAGTFANQIGALRGSLTMLATSTTSQWDVFGPTTANPRRLSLASGTSGAVSLIPNLDTGRQAPIAPRGATGALTWRYSIPDSNGSIYAFTEEVDVPNRVCLQFNQAATGSAADIVETTLAGSLTLTNTTGLVASNPGAGFLTAASAAGDAGCYVASAGASGRIVARLR